MADRFITGFHSVEEKIRTIASEKNKKGEVTLYYSSLGPRVKKILVQAQNAGISCEQKEKSVLDSYVADLSKTAQDHRGLVLKVSGIGQGPSNLVDFYQWIEQVPQESTVLLLDSVTDPHNVGAIIRSCDQFGVSLVILPERRGVRNPLENEIVSRASAGASAWVSVAVVPNLVRCAELLKQAGFWVYGADARGTSVEKVVFPDKTALVMGSEGDGIARLLEEKCDGLVSIPTEGSIDSLNVSVATGVLLYEIKRQKRCTKK